MLLELGSDLLVEHKRTVKNSISFKREWFAKVEAGAAALEKIPVLIITFEVRNGPPLDLAVVRRQDAQRLLGRQIRSEL